MMSRENDCTVRTLRELPQPNWNDPKRVLLVVTLGLDKQLLIYEYYRSPLRSITSFDGFETLEIPGYTHGWRSIAINSANPASIVSPTSLDRIAKKRRKEYFNLLWRHTDHREKNMNDYTDPQSLWEVVAGASTQDLSGIYRRHLRLVLCSQIRNLHHI